MSPRTDEQDSKGVVVAYGSGGSVIGGVSGGVTVSEHLEGRGQAEG